MNDMSQVIIPRSDQINADSLLAGPVVITIREVEIRPGTEQPVTIYYDGDEGKPWRPCKSMSRCLVSAWGPDARQYLGRSVRLFTDPNVTWGGMKVGGIRISHMSHIEREMVIALTATKGKKVMATIKPLAIEQRQQQPETDAAANWTKRYIGNVEKCTDIDELVKLENSQAVRLAELKEKRPELHKQITDASTARGAAVSKEGKPEDQTGEGFTDDAGEGPF